MRKTTLLLAAILSLTHASQAADITGKATFKGKAPSGGVINFNADAKCSEQHKGQTVRSQDILVNGDALVNAFVYVKSGLPKNGHTAPPQAVVLEQKGCWYSPQVVPLQVNQDLQIINSDPTMHNINVKPKLNTGFNLAQPTKGMKTTKKFAKPEVLIPVKCNVHPWMQAYIAVVDNPYYAVSDGKGNFAIKGLPAGKYVVEAVHPKLGSITKEVTVSDKSVNLQLSFTKGNPAKN